MSEIKILKSRTPEAQIAELTVDLENGLLKSFDVTLLDKGGIHDDDGVTFFNDYLNEKKWDVIGLAIVDMTGFDPDSTFSDHGCDVLSHEFISVRTRDRDTEFYFSDVVANAVGDDLDQIIEYEDNDDYEPGIYRIVFGLKLESHRYETEYGTEYDEENYIEVISRIRYSPKDEHAILEEQKLEEANYKQYCDYQDRINQYEQLDREGFFDQLREEGRLTAPKPEPRSRYWP